MTNFLPATALLAQIQETMPRGIFVEIQEEGNGMLIMIRDLRNRKGFYVGRMGVGAYRTSRTNTQEGRIGVDVSTEALGLSDSDNLAYFVRVVTWMNDVKKLYEGRTVTLG